MKYLKIVIFSLFLNNALYAKVLYGQSINEKEIILSSAAAKEFQDKISSGQIADLYNQNLDAEIKKSISHENFKKFIEDIRAILGARKNSILFNYKKINTKIIRVSYMSEFDKGVSVESYYISISPENGCSLFRYEITDPSKFVF